MSGGIRCGTCSVCGVALESSDGGPEGAKPRSRALRRQGHRHRKPWHVVPDHRDDEEHRDWHYQVPWGVL